jgi:hypothetical protein
VLGLSLLYVNGFCGIIKLVYKWRDIMGLFSDKRAKEERQREDKQKFIERYRLEDFDEEEIEYMYKTYKVTRFSGIQGLVDQNWIIIKQLNRLNKNIEELKKK